MSFFEIAAAITCLYDAHDRLITARERLAIAQIAPSSPNFQGNLNAALACLYLAEADVQRAQRIIQAIKPDNRRNSDGSLSPTE